MKAPDFPQNEVSRVASLHDLNILDTAAEERFDRLTRLARKMFSVPIAVVSLVDTNRQWFKSCMGLDATGTGRDVSFCGHAILQDEILVIPNALADERFHDNPLVTGEPNIRFYAGCPLRLGNGEKVGTLCIIDREAREFGEDDKALLRDLAQMAELELTAVQQATTDELTKISNRRGFQTLSKYALDVCRRQRHGAWLMMIDLDRFKAINDTYGHAEGDFVLVTYAAIMARVFRDSDVIGRLGGDEFAVLLTNTEAGQLKAILDRLAQAVAEHNATAGRGYDILYSAGTTPIDHGRLGSVTELLTEADSRMYIEKKRRHAEQDADLPSGQIGASKCRPGGAQRIPGIPLPNDYQGIPPALSMPGLKAAPYGLQ